MVKLETSVFDMLERTGTPWKAQPAALRVSLMGRIQKAYETQFAWLLTWAGARRRDEGVRRMLQQAAARARPGPVGVPEALSRTYERLSAHPFFKGSQAEIKPDRFFCDSGLGGLARWLRAAGYESAWVEGIADDELLGAARAQNAVLLTTDSMLMERRLLRNRIIPSFWLPPIHSIPRQLELVFREFGLRLRSPRCMRCGGKLRSVGKEAMKDRIPPRTYRWINDYFECERCGQLFWHGTHWLKIRRELQKYAV